MSLKDDLEVLKKEQQARLPEVALTLFDKVVRDLKSQGLEERALKVGQHIPDFTLPDALGSPVSSGDLLVRGPLVICFYRGAWCPYCNLELKALQESLEDFRSLGAQLVAISPMTPDNSLSLAEKHHLTFSVLSDTGLKVASQFGLVYHVPLELKAFFQSGGLDLAVYNGDGSWRLPMPATYVTDHDGIVVARVNADWRDRLDPLEIYSALQKIT